jgi:DDE superfamily endonuclease
VFHEVLCAIVSLYRQEVVLPTSETSPLPRVLNPKYIHFKDCLGALDGTHIEVHLPPGDHARYRNRKQSLSQNVLGVCDFDLLFVYMLAGWEGSAHDQRVLNDAQLKGLITPKGRYWLGDAGYHNSSTVMVPYRGVRYHLKEQWQSKNKPETYQELFNLRHSSLRNAIERIFGVAKRKFKVLKSVPEYSVEVQTQLVCAVVVLYNFVRRREGDLGDRYFLPDQEDLLVLNSEDIQAELEGNYKDNGSTEMDKKRDEIAKAMWKDYRQYLGLLIDEVDSTGS